MLTRRRRLPKSGNLRIVYDDAAWVRFEYYASRIRFLRLVARSTTDSRGRDATASNITTIMRRQACKGVPLFPNLRELRLPPGPRTCPNMLSDLLGKRIRALDLGELTIFHARTLSNPGLATRCPSLQSLKLTARDPRFYHLVASCIPFFPRLQSISVRQLQSSLPPLAITGLDAFFCATSSLADLRELSSDFCDPLSDPAGNPQLTLFPALKALNVRDHDLRPIQTCVRFLQVYRPQALCAVSLSYEVLIPALIRGQMNALSELKAALTSFTLVICKMHYELPFNTVPEAIIEPLLRFDQLQELSIRVPFPVNIDDNTIDRISGSLPGLRTLFISGTFVQSSLAVPTLRALRYLAERCPGLRACSFGLNACDDDLPMAFDGLDEDFKLANYSVRTISVDCSPVHRPILVAKLLSRWFPNLRSIKSQEFSPYRDQWAKVELALECQ